MNILFIGMGEIGRSVANLYKDANLYYIDPVVKDTITTTEGLEIKELLDNTNPPVIDICHICCGYFKGYVNSIADYLNRYNPNLTIIEGTVPIGITRDLYRYTDKRIVHSPVMGKHPNLTKSILTFTKIVSGVDAQTVYEACDHFKSLGVNAVFFSTPEASEAAKLLDTTYYGWNILFMKYVYKFCEERELKFDEVYGAWNKIYNEGYTAMGNPEFVRPILKYMPGKIKGHCIIPNMEILKNDFIPAKIGLRLNEEEV
jgi:hypothetical protein